jgi:hypothetical protein
MSWSVALILLLLYLLIAPRLNALLKRWKDKREYESTRNESNSHVTFEEWKEQTERDRKREEERKRLGIPQPPETGARWEELEMERDIRDAYLRGDQETAERLSTALTKMRFGWKEWRQKAESQLEREIQEAYLRGERETAERLSTSLTKMREGWESWNSWNEDQRRPR